MERDRLNRTRRRSALKSGVLALLLACSGWSGWPPPTITQEPTHQQLKTIDAPLLHTAGVLLLLAHQSYYSIPTSGKPLEPHWSWDRRWMGEYDGRADRWSKGLAAVGFSVPLLWSAEGYLGRVSQSELLVDALMIAEAVAIDASLNLWVRGHPLWARPMLFSEKAPQSERESPQARSSFYSGHASTAFAVATVAVSINLERAQPLIPTAPLAIVLYGGATTISALRVAAGKHYPTDVVAGAAIGSLIGWGVAALHKIPVPHRDGEGVGGLLRKRRLKVVPYPGGITVRWNLLPPVPQQEEIW